VSSEAHLRAPLDFDDLNFVSRPYDAMLAYGRSKTANVLFAVEATRRWQDDGITANAVHPAQSKVAWRATSTPPPWPRRSPRAAMTSRRPSREPPRAYSSQPHRSWTASAAATSSTATRRRSSARTFRRRPGGSASRPTPSIPTTLCARGMCRWNYSGGSNEHPEPPAKKDVGDRHVLLWMTEERQTQRPAQRSLRLTALLHSRRTGSIGVESRLVAGHPSRGLRDSRRVAIWCPARPRRVPTLGP
jgi:hypothetical protein